MSSESKTSFDLELNPFERSFATKDQHPRSTPAAPGSGAPRGDIPVSGLSKPATAIQDAGDDSEELQASSASSKADPLQSGGSTATSASSDAAGAVSMDSAETGPAASNNKHNLRLSNLSSVSSSENRLPGLTPPMFTPGGRRLPPIHLSPHAAMGTPETPGSSLWSSLLTATNGQGHEAAGQNYSQFASMARKSGLTPNEMNLRSGFTPGVGHSSFNFGHIPGLTPGGLNNGQMTPGLSSLLGLSHTQPGQPDATAPAVPGTQNSTSPLHPSQQAMSQRLPSFQPPSHPPQQATTQPVQTQAQANIQAPQNPAPTGLINGGAPGPSMAQPQSDLTYAMPAEPRPVVKQEDNSSKDVREPSAKRAKTSAGPKAKKEKKKEADKKKAALPPVDAEEEKRKQFLERNRVAASKCRQRKKQLFQKMEDELTFYSTGYRELSAQVSQLREQLLTLRGVVISLKNSPVLINAVGGYQQLQNIIGQTDYIAQAAANSQPNYHSIPTTIPTTLNASSQASSQSPPQDHKSNFMGPPQPESKLPLDQMQLQGDANQLVMGQNAGLAPMPYKGPNIAIPPGAPVEEVPRHFTGDINAMVNAEHQANLKNSSSTSNLQSKIDGGYNGLRNVASMANLQHNG